MNEILSAVLPWLVFGLLARVIPLVVRRILYRREWVEFGRQDRLEGEPPFRSSTKWIQSYYNAGYYESQVK